MNARSTARFIWLPAKGLDALRRTAVQQARWRDTADGFVERGPFEKARTTVSIARIAYDGQTGEARVEVKALDAGPRPVIRWSDTGPAVPSSPELKELSFSTNKLRLWFLAEDFTGDHPTGDAMSWRNEISILHEPRETSSGRVVELKAVPGGSLRWTFGGPSPRDMGAPYDGPVPIPPTVACCGFLQKMTISGPKNHLTFCHNAAAWGKRRLRSKSRCDLEGRLLC